MKEKNDELIILKTEIEQLKKENKRLKKIIEEILNESSNIINLINKKPAC